jgi:hypothetical protein
MAAKSKEVGSVSYTRAYPPPNMCDDVQTVFNAWFSLMAQRWRYPTLNSDFSC